MPGEFSPDKPLAFRTDPQINWEAFEYYSPLKRVLRHVSEHPGEALSLAQAAGIASFEYTHFSAYFRQKTGINFKNWIDCVRICRAAEILDSVDKSIIEVAQDSGFEDGTTFCRTFRRVTGMTPKQYQHRSMPPRRSLDIRCEG
jgi:AraC-like DNA-binding protein